MKQERSDRTRTTNTGPLHSTDRAREDGIAEDLVFLHYNDGDAWERCCISENIFNGQLSAKCEARSARRSDRMDRSAG